MHWPSWWSPGRSLGGCSSGSTRSFCQALQGPNPLDIFNSYDPSTASDAHATLQAGVNRLEQLGAVAPEQVRRALATLVEVAQQLATALDQRSSSSGTVATTVPDFASRADKITAASATVTNYAASKCGVQLDPSATTTTAAPPPSS